MIGINLFLNLKIVNIMKFIIFLEEYILYVYINI